MKNARKKQQQLFVKGDDSVSANVVDITPSKNILLKAGTRSVIFIETNEKKVNFCMKFLNFCAFFFRSDYNFACAIAELVDNSIQAVKHNKEGHRRIQVEN